MDDQPPATTEGRPALVRTLTPELLRPCEAAAMLGLSLRAFQSLEKSGRIGPRPIRFGKSVRFSTEELRAWVRERCSRREVWVENQAIRQAGAGPRPTEAG